MVVQAALAEAFVFASTEHWVTRELLLVLSVALGAVKAFAMAVTDARCGSTVHQSMAGICVAESDSRASFKRNEGKFLAISTH